MERSSCLLPGGSFLQRRSAKEQAWQGTLPLHLTCCKTYTIDNDILYKIIVDTLFNCVICPCLVSNCQYLKKSRISE